MSENPKLWESFELTMNSQDPAFESPPLVRKSGRADPDKWIFREITVDNGLKRWFKLVKLDFLTNWADLLKAITEKYKPTPSGLWIKSFMDKYPNPDGGARIIVPDASWTNPDRVSCYPCLTMLDRQLIFLPTTGKINGLPRCLVFSEAP